MRRDGNQTGLSALCGSKYIFPADLPRFGKLLVDVDGTPGKINAIPSEAQDFALTQAGEHRYHVDIFKLTPPDRCNEFPNIVLFQRGDFLFVDLRKITGISEIASAKTAKARKVVVNGRLVIETANGTFSATGARVK